MNHSAVTHSGHLRIASAAATLFALPVCRFLIKPRSVREVPPTPASNLCEAPNPPSTSECHTLGGSLPSTQNFSLVAQPPDQQPLRSSFATASRHPADKVGDGRGINPVIASRTDRHRPSESAARRTEADRPLAGAQLARCHAAVLRGRNDRASDREQTADTGMGGLGHGDGLNGSDEGDRVAYPCWGHPGSSAGSPDGTGCYRLDPSPLRKELLLNGHCSSSLLIPSKQLLDLNCAS